MEPTQTNEPGIRPTQRSRWSWTFPGLSSPTLERWPGRCGIFRGPTLRVTNRWIYVEPLLDGTIGLQLAAFVLARKVEAALRASVRAEAPTAIFQVKSAPRPLARHLSECLSLTGRYCPQPSELSGGEPPIGEQVPVGAKVVLCADTIRSEDTVRRTVAIVAGWDADPLVIACVWTPGTITDPSGY